MKKKDLCIYHADCADGFAAALAVQLHEEQVGRECEFRPMHYGQPAPDVSAFSIVYVVDFSFKRADVIALHEQALSLVVIDHHKTAQVELAGLDCCVFDMGKSGAVLTWETLFPGLSIPPLFLYVQDRDLWQWKIDRSREVSAAIRLYPQDFATWRKWLDADYLDALKDDGAVILQYQANEVAQITRPEKVGRIIIAGYEVPCLNTTTLVSEVGNILCQDQPFSATWFDTADGKRVFSLRSDKGGLDVGEIAKCYGGGGHPHAAGFTVAAPTIDLE